MLIDEYLNFDLHGTEFIELLRAELGLELTNNLAISTSCNATFINALFSRYYL